MRRLGLVVLVLALAAAACGGGTEDATTTTAAAAADTPSSDESSTTAAPTTTVAPTTTAAPETTTTAPAAAGASPLGAAIESSSTAESGRMEGSFIIVDPEGAPAGTEMAITFTGAFDTVSGSSSFTMNLGDALAQFPGAEEVPPELGGLFGDMEVRTIGDTAYVRFPFFSSMLGVDTEWISLPAEDAGSATSSFGPSPGNPADLLSAFGGVDADLEEVGREQVRGVDTTHYRFNADMEALRAAADEDAQDQLDELGALPGGGELPVDFWIGDDGLVYRFSFSIDGAAEGPDSGFEAMTMIWEMFDYGADVGIVPPPADQVSDGSSLSGVFGA